MIQRTEGIDRMQSSIESNTFQQNKDKLKLESQVSENKLAENKLSAKQLKNKLEEDIEDMNKIVKTLGESLSFKLHDDTSRMMVQIIDIKSREVLKEMPPEEMLDLTAKIHKIVGIIIDEKV